MSLLTDQLARLDPHARIAELEHQNSLLLAQRDREVDLRLHVEQQLARLAGGNVERVHHFGPGAIRTRRTVPLDRITDHADG